MFSLFGLIALLVAGVGLYGVLAFEVAQRRHDIGIRIALGAGAKHVLLPILRFTLPVVLIGLFAGAALAMTAAARVGPLLFQVSLRDPAIFAGAAVAITAAAIAALLIPARKATRVDPRETLA